LGAQLKCTRLVGGVCIVLPVSIFQDEGKAKLKQGDMNFNENQAIYIQIMELAEELILLGKWLPGEKIPSVRELAASLQVNPNTVMRAYEQLQVLEVLVNRRGIGHHVDAGASQKILSARREQFLRDEVPQFLKKLRLLQIDWTQLQDIYNQTMK
jgi:GntR family transcriptional regulator